MKVVPSESSIARAGPHEEVDDAPPQPQLPRVLYLALVLCQVFLCGGNIFGFFNLVPRMKDEGVYSLRCVARESGAHNSTQAGGEAGMDCDGQAVRFGLVFTVAAALAFSATLPLGQMLDRWGPRKTSCFCLTLVAVGQLMLATASPSSDGWFDPYLVGFCFLAFPATGLNASTFHVSNLFRQHHTVLAIINGTFDTSALVYSLVTLLPSSVTLNSVFWVFSVITVVLLVATAVIMPDHPFAPSTPLPSSSPSHSHADGASMKQVLPAAVPSPALVGAPKTTVDTVSCLEEGSAQPNLVPAPHGSIETAGDGPLETAPVAVDDDQAKPQAGEEDLGSQSPGHASPLQLLSIGQQVTTSKYIWVLVWFCFQQLRFSFTLGSMPSQLDVRGQGEDAPYTAQFGFILPFGALASLLAGFVSDRVGVEMSLLITNVIALSHDVLRAALPLSGQPAAFVAFAMFRGFLFSSLPSFLSQEFGFKTLGGTLGVLAFASALFSLLQYPLIAVSVEHDSFAAANWGMVGLGVLSFACWWRYSRKAQ